MSKDLIELDNDNALKKLDDMIDSSLLNTSGDKGTLRKKHFFDETSQQPSAILDLGKKFPEALNPDAEPFFEDAEFDPQGQIGDSNPIVFTDSGLDDAPKEHSNQTTLFLDSQSIIVDGPAADAKDHNMSQSLEASGILHPRDNCHPTGFFSAGGAQPHAMPSNAPSSNHNTDVLTYSLTNTITTIESLHDELTAIRNGLELSQKRGATIIKSIHQYAREIGGSEDPGPEEEAKYSADECEDGRPISFIRDIKGYYSRIHEEIEQLKTILIESGGAVQKPESPGKASSLIERSTLKQSINTSSVISVQGIEKTQEIIFELKKEMEAIFGLQQRGARGTASGQRQKKGGPVRPSKRSQKVLQLLESLQSHLVSAVTSYLNNS